jgi:predicted enzyme related to lactoylglutathione lyase
MGLIAKCWIETGTRCRKILHFHGAVFTVKFPDIKKMRTFGLASFLQTNFYMPGGLPVPGWP